MNNTVPYKEPVVQENSFNCPHCNSFSHMFWENLKGDRGNRYVADLRIAHCVCCDKYSVWYIDQMIFPTKILVELPNGDLTQEIKDDYNEAAQIVSISPRGAAALLRLAIQKLCRYLGEDDRDINTNIANLVKKGLSVRIQKALDTLRVVGNEAVHPGTLDLKDNREIAFALFKLINIIAEKMISEEKQIDELYNSLPEEKLEQIKDRDK
jgi:hypothetical protein